MSTTAFTSASSQSQHTENTVSQAQNITFPPQRPLFCHAALAGENENLWSWRFEAKAFENFLNRGSNEGPTSDEFAVESILRLAGRDPNIDAAWEGSGVTRQEAIECIEQRYKDWAAQRIEASCKPDHFKFDAYIISPSNLDRHPRQSENSTDSNYNRHADWHNLNGAQKALFKNDDDFRRTRPDHFLEQAVHYLRRAHVLSSPDGQALLEDKTWEDIGIQGGLSGLHKKIRALFEAKQVSGHMLASAGYTESYPAPNTGKSITEASADYYFRDQFPQGADKLGIPTKAALKLQLDSLRPQEHGIAAAPSNGAPA